MLAYPYRGADELIWIISFAEVEKRPLSAQSELRSNSALSRGLCSRSNKGLIAQINFYVKGLFGPSLKQKFRGSRFVAAGSNCQIPVVFLHGRNNHGERQLFGADKSRCYVGNWSRSGHRACSLRMIVVGAFADQLFFVLESRTGF